MFFGDSILTQAAIIIIFIVLYAKFIFEYPLKLLLYLTYTYITLSVLGNAIRLATGKEFMFFGFSNSMVLVTLFITGFVLMCSKEANPTDEEKNEH